MVSFGLGNTHVYFTSDTVLRKASNRQKSGDDKFSSSGSFIPTQNSIEIQGVKLHAHVQKSLQLISATDINSIGDLLRRCTNAKALSSGKQIHEYIVKHGLEWNRYLSNLLVLLYGKCSALQDARAVFDRMSKRNTFSWNIMISIYVQHGHLDEALHLFENIPKPDVVSWNAMIVAFAQEGKLHMALEIFQQMPERDIVSWNAILAGYCQLGLLKGALQIFLQMPQRDVCSWNTMIVAYAQQGHLDEALRVFHKMPHPDVVSWTGMVAGYVQKKELKEALRLFEDMPRHDVIAWNTIISAIAEEGQLNVALELFQQMLVECQRPDKLTFISILDACASNGALGAGKSLHAHIISQGFGLDTVVGTSLIDMYKNCGSLEGARNAFDRIYKHDTVSWTAMITAYAQYGYGKEALEIFWLLYWEGLFLTETTLVSLLLACKHAGLIDDGYYQFLSISCYFELIYTIDHFNCVVDILARAGELEVAEAFLNNMPLDPDAMSWASLLGCCKFVSRHLHLANRLDRDTSGILVITKCRTAAANLVKIFTTREIKKSYIALCVGSLPTWESITIESGHGRSKFGAWRIYAKRDVGRILPGGSHVKEMITCFSMVGYRKLSLDKKLKRCASLLSRASKKLIIVGENDNEVQRMAEAEGEPAKDESDMHHEVLVRAFPLTGRTHQIRLHCQHLGLSLRGDAKYGGPLLLNGEQYGSHALHAETIAFEHPLTFQKIDIAAPIPPWAKGFEIGLPIN